MSKLYESARRIEPGNLAVATVYLDASGRVFVNNEEATPDEIPQKLGATPPADVRVYEDDPSEISDPDYLQTRTAFWNALTGRYFGRNSATAASVSAPKRTHFDRVCHSLLALLFAFVGGLIATWFQRRESTAENRLA